MPPTLSRIAQRYEVLQTLGEGLSGEVYLVEGPEGREALKLLKPFADRELEEGQVAAFKFEFGLLKDLNHPNVVRIGAFGFDEGLKRFYFTEEFLEGCPIQEYCRDKAPERIEALFLQALQGLHAIHRAHILHGDIKSNNLLVVESADGPLLKFIDLGLADPRFPFTAGTPATMAPEKILRDPADERSDLYSLGVVFYHLFTGENPFVRQTVEKTYEAHLSLRPPKLTLKNPKAPPIFNEILATLLAKNPAYRYRDCTAVLEALDFARPRAAGAAARRAETWRPDLWVVRPGITDAIFQEILQAWRSPKQAAARAFLISGESGVGKSRLVQEVKYRLQMEKGKTVELRPNGAGVSLPKESADLWILEDWNLFPKAARDGLLKKIASNSTLALVTTSLEDAPTAQAQWEGAGLRTRYLEIPPLNSQDLSEFLAKLTGLAEIPDAFLQGLLTATRGNPQAVIGVLQNLVKQKKVVDANGRWNLAIFKEGEGDLAFVPLEIPQIDQALAQLSPDDHPRRTQLWLQRGEELLKKNLLAEAAAALQEAEQAANHLSDWQSKFHLKARIHEKNGYRLIREGRLEEARHALQQALTLIHEGALNDEVLSIRTHNFLAWLLCHEGKVDTAIARFLEQHERWKKLDETEQARILNNDLGYAYLLKGDTEKATAYLEEYLPFYEKADAATSRMKAYYNLAEARGMSRDHRAAIQHYLQAADLARQEKNYEFLLRAYNGLGKSYHLQGETREALNYYQRALELARYLEDFSSACAIAQNIGSIHSEAGDYDAARSHFETALKMIQRTPERSAHDKYLQCRALLEMGDLFRKQKRYEEALGYIHEAHQLAFQEEALAAFRFWVIHTQCKVERDQRRLDKLQDLLAELLPLADDETKREACHEFSDSLPDTGRKTTEEPMNQTRPEIFRSDPASRTALQALIQVARWLTSEREPERLLELILRQAVQLSGAEAGMLLLEADGELKVRSSVNLRVDDPLQKMSTGVAREVLKSGRPLLTGDALQDGRFNVFESVVTHHLQSVLALPIPGPSGTLGVLALLHRFRSQAFTPESVELLAAFADLGGIALENARLLADLSSAKEALSRDLERAHEELDEARRDLSDASLIERFARSRLLSRNREMLALFQLVERIKDTSLAVLLQGESGTGKERIARTLHQHSRRAKAPFVAVNCAAIPNHLIESELFGYKAGAFTGATRDKKGLIAEAHGGTLFLDEIAELDVSVQAKLLRVLQEKEITRLGDTKPASVDFRLVSATHQNLKQRVTEEKFREDLYYRVCEIELKIPPLRERGEDVALLAEVFVKQYLDEHEEKAKVHLGRDLLKVLMDYAWPGNVRELENVIRVGVALRRGSSIHLADLPASLQKQLLQAPAPKEKRESRAPEGTPKTARGSSELFDPNKTWEEMELLLIAKSLIHHHFDVVRAAKALDCAPSKIYQRLREHRLEERRRDWENLPFLYREGSKLAALKKEVFAQAMRHWGGSPYQTAKALGVSPGMVYKWTS